MEKFFAVNRFKKDEGGAITAFVLILFLIMVVGGGMAVDFMRHESERIAFQDTLDRGVLAAASFDQQGDAKQVVLSYLSANGYDPEKINLEYADEIKPNSRKVVATANYEVPTFFLRIINIVDLTVAAASGAAVADQEIEVSLVVDISASMDWWSPVNPRPATKLDDLKDAASVFFDLMLAGNKPSHTTISLVPFSAEVAVPKKLADFFNLQTWHNYSYCFEIQDADYDSTALSRTTAFQQSQTWTVAWTNRYNGKYYESSWCPKEGSEIIPFSNSAEDLKEAVNSMEYHNNTAAWAGLKWGTALLDETSRDIFKAYQKDTPSLAGVEVRPAKWANPEVDALKILVLMSDGANTEHQQVIANSPYSDPFWTDPEQYTKYYNVNDTTNWRTQANADYWHGRTSSAYSEVLINSTKGDELGLKICAAAKAKGIVVYTIAFDLNRSTEDGIRAYEFLETCASSPATFHDTAEKDLTEVFIEIAASIQKLRLVQ